MMNKSLSDLILTAIESLAKAIVEGGGQPNITTTDTDKVISSVQSIVDLSPKDKVEQVVSLNPITKAERNPRFIKISENWYYNIDLITTTFANLEDFAKSDTFPLATGSSLKTAHKGQMKGIRGVSLSAPIVKGRIVYPVNPKNGLSFGYHQEDVGPGYDKDPWWIAGTTPKNESGIDMYGHKSPKSSLDVFPQVLEDLGLATFDDSYNKSLSFTLNCFIYEPTVPEMSKVVGHSSPSDDSRSWIQNLPDTGSPYFTWRELLRGWNRATAPDNEVIQNLIKLTKELLHPCRVAHGPIRLGSGLRDPETNAKVGGREGSFHMVGRAADLIPSNITTKALYEWVNVNLKTVIRESVLEDFGHPNEHLHIAGPRKDGEPTNIHEK
jgi:hypothetical protein